MTSIHQVWEGMIRVVAPSGYIGPGCKMDNTIVKREWNR
jgi:hypothetical protein